MKKNKWFFFLSFLIILFFCASSSARALEVTAYPSIPLPGVTSPTSSSTLAQVAVYYFAFMIYIAGVIALISFVVGAAGLIISADNPETASNAKDRMKGAILGLLLTLVSFIILNTINTALVTLKLTPTESITAAPPPPIPGVFFYLKTGCEGDVSGGYVDPQNYISAPFGGKIKSIKIVNDKINYRHYGTILHRDRLGGGGECSAPIINSSDNDLCVAVNMPVYGADIFVYNNSSDISPGDGVTFYSEPFGPTRSSTSGFYKMKDTDIYITSHIKNADEMCFDYSNYQGESSYKRNCNSTSCNQPKQTCFDNTPCPSVDQHCNNGVCVDASGSPQCSDNGCTTFRDCPRSMKIQGNYLVALYSKQYCKDNSECQTGEACQNNSCKIAGQDALFCETFDRNDPGIGNLNDEEILAAGSYKIDSVSVIPVQ